MANTRHWTKLAPLPDREGFAFPYAGISNGALLVAGLTLKTLKRQS